MQGITIIEPIIAKAARKLEIDQVEIRRINAPGRKGGVRAAGAGKRPHATSCIPQGRARPRRGEVQLGGEESFAPGSGIGSKVRGIGVSLSSYVGGTIGFDGLFVIKPEGRVYCPVRNRKPRDGIVSDVHRVGAEILGVPWEKCEVTWGNTSKNLPWSCVFRRQPDDTCHDARGSRRGMDAQAANCSRSPRKRSAASRKIMKSAASASIAKAADAGMTFAQAAQRAIELGGIYDGHEAARQISTK